MIPAQGPGWQPTMTGQDLLDALQRMTPEQLAYEVEMEGCDCTGMLATVDTGPAGLYLLLTRPTYDSDRADAEEGLA